MTERQLREQIERLTVEGRASCKALLELAARTGSSPHEIGRLCDEMKIRISNCQLGCFR